MGDSDSSAPCHAQASLDHHARLVRRLLRVPTSMVTVVEPRRQVFPGAAGLLEPWATTRETPLSHSFCRHVVRQDRPLVVADARTDDRVSDNLAIPELGVVAYAGWPLRAATGRAIGSLCAIDSRPRRWTDEELEILSDLARACQAELQAAEREAGATEHLVRAVFSAVDVSLAFYDPAGRLLLANDTAWRAAEAAGFRLDTRPWAGVEVRETDNLTPVPPDQQLVPRALRGEQVDSAVHWVGPPGRQLALAGSSRLIRNPDGTPRGTLVIAQDVTRLVRALQRKDDFLATVSHELRTPLTSIIGYLELLSESLEAGTAEGVPEAIGVIDRNARSLQRRVSELVTAADRRRVLVPRRTDLCGLARGVADTLGKHAEALGVALLVDCRGPQWANVDHERVEQALENLVANALTFTEPGGRVSIEVTGTPDEVSLVVRDTGVGMTTDEVSHACDLFWRAESSHRAAVRGLGIGLAFVRDTVEAHDGRLRIDSEPGRGTTITVALARRTAAGRVPAQPTGPDVTSARH